MKTMFKTFSMLAVAACAGMCMVSCTADKDLYNPEVVEQNAKAEYEANFLKRFGDIKPNQTWDFAGAPFTIIADDNDMATRMFGDTEITCTPDATNTYYNAEGWFDVPASLQKSMNNYKERQDNTSEGWAYVMSIPQTNFTIIPLRQGYSTRGYEVHMVVGTGNTAVDYLLWEKGGMMQKRSGNGAWTNLQDAENSISSGNVSVRSKAITFEDMPTDQPMYFYVKRPTNPFLYPSSLDGYMLDITDYVGVPAELSKDGKNQVRIIGVEAQYDYSAVEKNEFPDNDYEDIMFAIVGETVPQDIPEIEKLKFKQTIAKRYMIEDLGDTDDFDFNDIVVDVKSSRILSFKKIKDTGELIERNYGPWEDQSAKVYALGGTLDFNLKIGNTSWKKSDDFTASEMINTEPKKGKGIDYSKILKEYTVEGWNPFENNISVEVNQKDGQTTNSINFPQKGNVPMIIATTTDKTWSNERISILDSLKDLILKIFGL